MVDMTTARRCVLHAAKWLKGRFYIGKHYRKDAENDDDQSQWVKRSRSRKSKLAVKAVHVGT
jgi:hypothetical protein